jgi:tetratricopeptide (TPR) repeat protein
MIKKIFLLSAIFCGTLSGVAQTKTEGDYIRSGNKFYADSLYEKAEIEYRKALEINPKSTDAMYNLGNALFNQIPQSQEKGKEAMEQYATAAKLESDKAKLAHINHNLGTLLYMAQQYPQSVEAYKESLRNNPNDNETRYNLAKAMYMLKQQQEQQQDQQQEQQQDQQQVQQQDQQQEQQQDQQHELQQEQQQQDQQEQQQNQEQQQEQQSQQDEEQISKENAEQILNALMQDEKDIQEKQKKMMQQHQGKTLDKDW